MVAKFGRFKLTNGTGDAANVFFFTAPTGSYDGIGTETGVVETTNEVELSMPTCTVESLLGSSVATRLTLLAGAEGERSKRREILCSSDKADTAKTALLTKSIGTLGIRKVLTPRRARFK